MDQKLQDELFEKYPKLFVNKNKNKWESCMCYGIECGDGWLEIISSLCWRIEQHEKSVKARLKYEGKDEAEYISVTFDQVKEKFGGLRAYYSGGDDYIEGVIALAEDFSYKTCEVCGKKGSPNKQGWISTLCEEHRNEPNAKE